MVGIGSLQEATYGTSSDRGDDVEAQEETLEYKVSLTLVKKFLMSLESDFLRLKNIELEFQW